VARHRRPVNVRDDGLTAVLGPLTTVGGVERAVLLDVDSGMVLDAWARGEASSSDSAVPGTGSRDHGPASGAGSAQSDETVPDGAVFGAGSAPGLGPEPGGASFGPGSVRSDETVPGGVARPGFGSLWRSLLGDHPADPGVDRTEAPGDVEAFGARHADLVRALLALPGSPPAELSLVVDDRHHLLRCVADPAGGRLALAVVVVGSPWVVRRVRRHLRQLPDAGLTTGPWLLTWAVGPPPTPWPPAEPATDGLPSGALDGLPPAGHTGSSFDAWPAADGHAPPAVDRPLLPGHDGLAFDGAAASPAGWAPNGHPGPPLAGGVGDPGPGVDGERPSWAAEPWPEAADGSPPPGPPAHDGSDEVAADPAAVPDPRRGPAPPSALPPARSAGSR